eukprot:CAMPEP_0203740168 /NCGR_PEP_ID=MMETSP0092-20131115/48823_1 /ASSEMBLY_ACC=CAM_ASM_001090 /TAXON_ID=426623 /ORGANISM="Chaetoceros affinis, Strain CCMP159" /LENGTH=70 /DNA_ID=CAMNT_0050626499 /DNA_START=83 /DNA_END=292 /DNA_ORIENTATION=-
MTGCGTSFINLPRPAAPPKTIWSAPAKMAHALKYVGPCKAQRLATTTEHAPLAEEHIPALPPKQAATKPK